MESLLVDSAALGRWAADNAAARPLKYAFATAASACRGRGLRNAHNDGSTEMPLRIAGSERVKYRINPIAEVICQVRFPRILLLDERPPVEFQERFLNEYPRLAVQAQAAPVEVRPGAELRIPTQTRLTNTYHFSSEDALWKVSLNSQFFALSCTRYEDWDGFLGRFRQIEAYVAKQYRVALHERVGLRYQDVIDREALELGDVPWRELLAPFALGPFAADGLFEAGSFTESGIKTFSSQTQMQLDGCEMLLRTALLRQKANEDRTAFLLDADYYVDDARQLVSNQLYGTLEILHANAGKFFRHCIAKRLVDALGVESV